MISKARAIVHQGLNEKQEIDIAQIKASVLEDVFREEKHETLASTLKQRINSDSVKLLIE